MVAEPRITSDFWVRAYLARLQFAQIPVFVRARGDETAGAVFVKLNTLDGKAVLYQRGFAFDGPRGWVVAIEGEDAAVEDALSKQLGFDRDAWVLEVESADRQTLLEEEGLWE